MRACAQVKMFVYFRKNLFMEREKNLTKSFGIRVPLGMYLRMIEVSAERKISITDICLYALSNSSFIGMANGGVLLPSPTINYESEIAILRNEIGNLKTKLHARTTELAEQRDEQIKLLAELKKSNKSRDQFRVCMEESDAIIEENKVAVEDYKKVRVFEVIRYQDKKSFQSFWKKDELNNVPAILKSFNDYLSAQGYHTITEFRHKGGK